MSRVINPDSAGKERTRLTKCIVLAIREMAKQSSFSFESRDLAAFLALALHIVSATIETTVTPWEKRGYWVKADRFRMEWAWAGDYSKKMKKAILEEDWDGVANIAAFTAQKLSKVTVPAGHRLGQPWIGAWKELNNQQIKLHV